MTAVVIAVMAVFPAFVPRTEGRQDAFAWEMFTEAAPLQIYDVETTTGSVEYQPQDVLEVLKADVDYARVLPAYLCRTVPGAIVVTVRQGDSVIDRVVCP